MLNKSIYRQTTNNERLFIFKNIKGRSQLPIFDFSFINNTDNTVLLDSIECVCEELAVARAGFPPIPNGILKPTKKFLINFKAQFNKPDKQIIDLENPIYVYPKSPLRLQIQNKRPLVNFYRIYFVFKFNNINIQSPELFFNSDYTYSGKIITTI